MLHSQVKATDHAFIIETAFKLVLLSHVLKKEYIHLYIVGTSLLRSLMGLGESDLNREVAILQGGKHPILCTVYYGIQFGTEQG